MQIHKMHSFLDYIMGGCQIQFTVSCFCVYPFWSNEGWEWYWVCEHADTKDPKSLELLRTMAEILCGPLFLK